jgi:broad specificity phosphatase PhoE
MILTITRHGETIENKKRICMGQSDGTLSTKGKAQVKQLAKRLKNEKFDVIYSSDLGRCVKTTKQIMKFHAKIPVFYCKELRERDIGKYVGKPYLVNETKLPKEFETWISMKKRAKKILNKVLKKHPKQRVLFVTHGGIIIVLKSIILNKPLEEFLGEAIHDNAAVTVIEINKNKEHKVHMHNCGKHLR